MIDKNLCYVLKQVRLKHAIDDEGNPLNITDFAKKLGVSRSAISEVEALKREPSKKIIKRIKEVFGINLYNLWLDYSTRDGFEADFVSTDGQPENSKEKEQLLSLQSENASLREQIKALQQERDSWRDQAMFLKGLLEKKQT